MLMSRWVGPRVLDPSRHVTLMIVVLFQVAS
jgi:hypothetical protein